MKDLQDLCKLIIAEKEMSEGKTIKFLGEINLVFQYVSFGAYEEHELCDTYENDNRKMARMSIKNEAEINLAYLTIYNFGRLKKLKEKLYPSARKLILNQSRKK